jgi:3-oxoacyl-[acyl-carrier protein] reductase
MTDTLALDGRAAIVTGAGNGLGRAEALALAAAGARVVLNDLAGDAVQAVAEEITAAGGEALVSAGDIGEWATGQQLVAAALGAFGRLDILVNNAGVTHWGAVAQTSLEDFDRLVAVNARAPFLMMQAASERLSDGGRVVNISSGVTSTAVAGIALYSGVKAFLDQVTRVAAVELAGRGITVNAVAPGSTATGPFASLTAEQKVAAGTSFGIGRIGEPADTAAVVAFLASAEAGFVTGQVIYVVGGQHGPVRLDRG